MRQPYDDVIPYWRFSIRLHKADLPALEELLGGIHEARITALQYGLMKCARHTSVPAGSATHFEHQRGRCRMLCHNIPTA